MTNVKLKLNADKLRKSAPTPSDVKRIKRRKVYIICDNILDTYNIGSIFRLADAVAASGIYLCAGSETPPNVKIARAAVGTEKWVPWKYFPSAKDAILKLKTQNSKLKIVAVEQHQKAIDFRELEYKLPIVFVVGHETTGVSEETLKYCDEIVELPMYGVNVSLNVMVSLAIVLYKTI